jgi:hypothetical protein
VLFWYDTAQRIRTDPDGLAYGLLSMWPKNKLSLEHQLVWNLQAVMRESFRVVEKYIEIYVSRAFVQHSFSAKAVLNALKNIK